MSPSERAQRLVGDMPWVTENLSPGKLKDFERQIASCLNVAVAEEREACAEAAFQWEPEGTVADDLSKFGDPDVIGDIVSWSVAAAIRARSKDALPT